MDHLEQIKQQMKKQVERQKSASGRSQKNQDKLNILDASKVEELFNVAEFYPVSVDVVNGHLKLARYDLDNFKSLPFHDSRAFEADTIFYHIFLAKLFQNHNRYCVTSPPINYIFHTAFCGSTLLTKLLSGISGTFVYREPPMLGDLAVNKDIVRSKLPPGTWTGLLNIAANLHARTPNNHNAVVKQNNNCNNLIGDLLALNPKSNALILYSTLEDFLISTLKNNHARIDWVRTQLKYTNWPDYPQFSDIDVLNLSDEKACACLWLIQMHIVLQELSNNPSSRTLNSNSLFTQQANVLKLVCEYFSIQATDVEINKVIVENSNTHSKTGSTFSLDALFKAQNAIKLTIGKELDNACKWSQPWIERLNIPAMLPNPLISQD